MSDGRVQLVAAWWAKAEEDLAVATLLIRTERRLLSAGVYHCQQAVEKALKAWLTAQDRVFPKTHDLEVLLHLAASNEVVVPEEMRIAARELTPLATVFRYPGDLTMPTWCEADSALNSAEFAMRYIRELISTARGK